MKRYVAFVIMDEHEQAGGWDDVLKDASNKTQSFDSVEAAQAAAYDRLNDRGDMISVSLAEYHIVDLSIGEIVLAASVFVPKSRSEALDVVVKFNAGQSI